LWEIASRPTDEGGVQDAPSLAGANLTSVLVQHRLRGRCKRCKGLTRSEECGADPVGSAEQDVRSRERQIRSVSAYCLSKSLIHGGHVRCYCSAHGAPTPHSSDGLGTLCAAAGRSAEADRASRAGCRRTIVRSNRRSRRERVAERRRRARCRPRS